MVSVSFGFSSSRTTSVRPLPRPAVSSEYKMQVSGEHEHFNDPSRLQQSWVFFPPAQLTKPLETYDRTSLEGTTRQKEADAFFGFFVAVGKLRKVQSIMSSSFWAPFQPLGRIRNTLTSRRSCSAGLCSCVLNVKASGVGSGVLATPSPEYEIVAVAP